MTRYRLLVFEKPAAPWRSTRDEAMADAVEQGHAKPFHEWDTHPTLMGYADIETDT